MAQKPLRPCRRPGCPELTRDGWCPKHKPEPIPHRRSARRVSVAWHSWYNLPVWRDDLRPSQLLREPLCRECARRGLRTEATDVDHIRDHKGDWALFADRDNLQSLCHACHSRKTMRDLWQKRKENQYRF